MGFGDFLLGSRPDMKYTPEQTQVYGGYMSLFNQPNNMYGTKKRYRDYNEGRGDTQFLQPLAQMYGRNNMDRLQNYQMANATGFNQGGGALAAGAADRILRTGIQDQQNALAGAYANRGDQLFDQMMGVRNFNQDRQFRALSGAGSIAGSGPYDNRRRGGFLGQILDIGVDLAKASAGAPPGVGGGNP